MTRSYDSFQFNSRRAQSPYLRGTYVCYELTDKQRIICHTKKKSYHRKNSGARSSFMHEVRFYVAVLDDLLSMARIQLDTMLGLWAVSKRHQLDLASSSRLTVKFYELMS